LNKEVPLSKYGPHKVGKTFNFLLKETGRLALIAIKVIRTLGFPDDFSHNWN